MNSFPPEQLHDFDSVSSLEWIETNGIGGYSSSTVSGAHSRRYHGLLVASKHPPVERVVVLSKLDETIVVGDLRAELGCNRYPGVVHPAGYKYLKSFIRGDFPEFVYEVGEIELKKTVAAIQGENTVVVLYESVKGPSLTLELLPLCSARDFHHTTHENGAIFTGYIFDNGILETKNYHDSPELFISVPGSEFEATQHWYKNFEFAIEQERGLDYTEDLFNHGKFRIQLQAGDTLGIIISTEHPAGRSAVELLNAERQRRKNLMLTIGSNELTRRLTLAADQFIVLRGAISKSMLAGYHWFSDWGRDTMISLPGLCLTTGRHAEAREILLTFSSAISEGMIPNRFSDYGESPEYNTVDATLWFVISVYRYFESTHDNEFATTILPVLKDIIAWHDRGTRFGIRTDQDGLLSAGAPGVQLTWMDAKVGDWVVTPRNGKAVEINALWYNALSVIAYLCTEMGDASTGAVYKERSRVVKTNFNKLFWYKEGGYLFDYVDGPNSNSDIRPNQIFAISLPFALLSKDKAIRVFECVTEKLLTPRGLRSLSPDHPDYKPFYSGDQKHRDAAYHQGTVWPFLLGAYFDACMQIKGTSARTNIARYLQEFATHLNEAGVGSVSEIFDGEYPHHPRGCMAQAWSVGEILRIVTEHKIDI